MLRIVLDTAVVATALRSRSGAGNAVLQRVANRRVVPLATTTLVLEYEAVLKRPEQRVVTGLTIQEIEQFMAELAALCEPVEVHFRWRPQTRDPADEMVLEAAVNGKSDAIVTYNVRDLSAAAKRFGIPVLLPRDMLKEDPDE